MLKEAALAATVKVFLHILTSRLTQWDQQLSKKDNNIYRLGLLFEAANKVADATQSVADRDDPEAMEILRKAIKKNFTDVAPIRSVLKQMDAWEQNKKLPKLASITNRVVNRYLSRP